VDPVWYPLDLADCMLEPTARRGGVESSHDSPLEGSGFELPVPRCALIANSAAAVLNGGFHGGEKSLDGIQPVDLLVERGHGRIKMAGQSVNLLGIENRVAFHKRNFDFDGCALVVGACLGDLVGIDDKRTFLTLAQLAAELGGQLVGLL
jgi:hypothetical protein